MALATAEDVETALGRDLSEAEQARVDTLLDEASDLVIGYLGCDPTDEDADPPAAPDAVARVVARMVSRVLDQPAPVVGSESTTSTAGPFSQTVKFAADSTSGAPWLTSTDKVKLRPYRCGGGMRTVGLSSDQTGRYRRYS